MLSPSVKADVQSIRFDSIRNISCSHDLKNNRKVLVGRVLASEILDLNTDENVRAFLVDAEGLKKKRKGDVHRKIEDTIENDPETFCVLNGGVTVVARDYEVDEKAKTLQLLKPSIINGAQTQGILRGFASASRELDVFVTLEIIVTQDEALIAEISVSRNFQNNVQSISIAGRMGILDDLQAVLKAADETLKLRMKETQRSDDYTDTEKLIQVLMALTPADLLKGTVIGRRDNKAYAYSQKATCLKDFTNVYQEKDSTENAALYQFFLDIAPQALELYLSWKENQAFQGCGLRSIERNGREILEVPDGIIFPILASLSVFAKKTQTGWKIEKPAQLTDEELVNTAKVAYQKVAHSNPQSMGKDSACYLMLQQLTEVYKKLTS